MEIRMVRCPGCGTVYNEAMTATCPGCGGAQSGTSGFGKTTMPGGGNNSFSAPASGQGFAPVSGMNSFPKTSAPNSFGAPAAGTFSKTEAPGMGTGGSVNSFGQTISGFSAAGVIGGTFPKTAPPADSKFVHTQYVGEAAVTRNEMRVTGWLVAKDGKNQGRDYHIHTGYNYIGKEKGDIVIGGDECISREKDSQIFFDDETCTFYLAHVNGANALRVNGEPVIAGSVKLNAYDELTIGKTHLIFVPLCCDKFKWEAK